MGRARMMIESLPLEVVAEILSWLPVKPLLRFRCVSKTWLRLLTMDTHFIKLHQTKANNNKIDNPGIVVLLNNGSEKTRFYYAEEYTACDEARVLHFPFNISYHYEVSGICNGLICMTDFSDVHVWNPLTCDHIAISCSPISQMPARPKNGSKHCAKNVLFGFGFHQSTNQYKVISLVSPPKSKMSPSKFQSHVNVFTLGTGSWRTLADIPYRISLAHSSTALVNGALHWFASRPGSSPWSILLSFDIKDEFFHEIPQLNGVTYAYPNSVSVGVLGGLLSMFCALLEEGIQIWVMKEYGAVNSWTKQFKIGTPQIPEEFGWLTPLGITNHGEIIIKKDIWELILYDPKTNSIRNLKKFGVQMFCNTYTYIGSLVSPKLLTDLGTSMR